MLTIRNTIHTVAAAGALALLGFAGSAQAQSAYWAGASQGACGGPEREQNTSSQSGSEPEAAPARLATSAPT